MLMLLVQRERTKPILYTFDVLETSQSSAVSIGVTMPTSIRACCIQKCFVSPTNADKYATSPQKRTPRNPVSQTNILSESIPDKQNAKIVHRGVVTATSSQNTLSRLE
mmetsp:Transcript_23230/g.37306  ORF Transcript_23230/g.37306 Transcript_23230/m.37306 type:complete len:108 (-) Transcript_23230:432-755(-)